MAVVEDATLELLLMEEELWLLGLVELEILGVPVEDEIPELLVTAEEVVNREELICELPGVDELIAELTTEDDWAFEALEETLGEELIEATDVLLADEDPAKEMLRETLLEEATPDVRLTDEEALIREEPVAFELLDTEEIELENSDV